MNRMVAHRSQSELERSEQDLTVELAEMAEISSQEARMDPGVDIHRDPGARALTVRFLHSPGRDSTCRRQRRTANSLTACGKECV
jgi:hypothetical protein